MIETRAASATRRTAVDCVTVNAPHDLPPSSDDVVDVALLDMNHGWANLGHDAIVATVRRVTLSLSDELADAGLALRVLSFPVRDRFAIPEPPGDRFGLYLGTGGPGHIDPHRNRRDEAAAGEIVESAAWERPLFSLFDAIAADPEAALIGVCHTFGVMCRWAGVAEPALRDARKGGKSAGVRDYVLTPQARAHPWFAALAAAMPDGRSVPVLDSRFYDLIPTVAPEAFPGGMMPIAFEARGGDGRGDAGDAMTMLEFARAADGRTPRIFAVNFHPEIGEAAEMRALLAAKLARGEITRAWHDERLASLPTLERDGERERRRLLAGEALFSDLIRHHLQRRIARRRASAA